MKKLLFFAMFCAIIICFSLYSINVGAEEERLLPVIMYHSVVKGEDNVGKYVLSAKQFEEDIRILKEEGFSFVTFNDLIVFTKGEDLAEKPVMITFDDGCLNNLTVCGPILKKYDARAVISPVGIFCDAEETVTWKRSDNYSYLTWNELSIASESGVFEVQNHSYNMHGGSGRSGVKKVSGESEEEFLKNIEVDIRYMNEDLSQRCGIVPTCFTYPYGAYCRESEKIVKKCGFKGSLTCTEKLNYITKNPDSLFCIGRFNRPSGISSDDFFKEKGIIEAS